jgi:DNA-binding CsgD family transcriptional regulator
MQAICRYLVDVRGKSFTQTAQLIGRKPKSVWTSYHQTTALPRLEESIPVPLRIFSSAKAPLEALVHHLKGLGLRNIEIAQLLMLDPRTTWTAAKRGEAKP